MTLLDKLKSLFGMSRTEEPASEVDVTVEREGNATFGTGEEETADDDGTTEGDEAPAGSEAEPVAEGTDASGSTESIVDDDAETEPETAAEPGEAVSSGDETVGESPDTEADPVPADGDAADVEVVKGVGPAYAERLADAGVETVDELAAADAAELATAIDVSESRIERWIDRAKNRED